MARLILVDSSIFIGLTREQVDPLQALTARATAHDWVTCGIVRLEVIRGVKRPRTKQIFSDFLDLLTSAPTTARVWKDAAELAWTLDRRGLVLPAADILIACCARSIGAGVLSYDEHFALIPGLDVFSRLEDLN
jgi:predicted nucleic acid-binding protein